MTNSLDDRGTIPGIGFLQSSKRCPSLAREIGEPRSHRRIGQRPPR
jgi:hypothetical protein